MHFSYSTLTFQPSLDVFLCMCMLQCNRRWQNISIHINTVIYISYIYCFLNYNINIRMGRCHCAGCFKVANTWTFRPTRALRAALLSPVHHLFPAFRKEPQISVIIYIRSQQDALRSFPCVGDQKVQSLRSLSLKCQVLGEAD